MAKKKNKRKTNGVNFTMAIALIILVILAVVVTVISAKRDNVPADSQSELAETTAPASPEGTADPSPDDTSSPAQSGTSTTPDGTTATSSEDTPTDPPVDEKKFYNPLTGLECSEEISKQRPVAIMINNIHVALPQEGVANADVVYECLAEGGITRLMMLAQDYASLDQVGSIRSSRDYFLDFAQNHDAIYFHAGGSPKAYNQIAARKINNCDAGTLEGSNPQTFFRDPWRRQNYAWEHTLVIKGEGIVNAIKMMNYRTELKSGFTSPFDFADEKITLDGSDAKCVYLPFSYYQAPYLKYDASTGTYKRWQYNQPHKDKDGTQLEFENIIVLFTYHSGPLDSSGRIAVTTTGNGEGYYITGGKYVSIKYSKATVDSPVKLMNADGTPLEINTGKTYVAVFNQANKATVNMNYNA